MAKKLFKKTFGKLIGGGKKKAATPDGQPIVTPIDGAGDQRTMHGVRSRLRRKQALGGSESTILSDRLGI